MNLSRTNLTETKLEILILEYLNHKPFLEELINDTEGLRFYFECHYVIYGPNRKYSNIKYRWVYCPSTLVYKNWITRELFDKFNGTMKNRFNTTKSYIWY